MFLLCTSFSNLTVNASQESTPLTSTGKSDASTQTTPIVIGTIVTGTNMTRAIKIVPIIGNPPQAITFQQPPINHQNTKQQQTVSDTLNDLKERLNCILRGKQLDDLIKEPKVDLDETTKEDFKEVLHFLQNIDRIPACSVSRESDEIGQINKIIFNIQQMLKPVSTDSIPTGRIIKRPENQPY
jgi:hypothetical protein